ncbi:MAG: hypothetical protein AB8B85_18330 [Paracoccaceae bacterium]
MQPEHEMHTRRKGRNLGVVGALVGLVVLLFAVTIVKLGDNVGNPTAGASWGESLMNWINE